MKKIFLTAFVVAFALLSFAATPSEVNEKVLAAFSKTFKDANNVVWHEFADYYEVRFVQNAIDTRVRYDLKGNILESVRYYHEESLPLFIKSKLHTKYPDKKIFGVTELTKEGELNYYIVLEDEKCWTTINSDYFGNTSVYQKFKKSKP